MNWRKHFLPLIVFHNSIEIINPEMGKKADFDIRVIEIPTEILLN